MDKKRSVGVSIFCWIWMLSAIMGILIVLGSISTLYSSEEIKSELLAKRGKMIGVNSVAELDNYYAGVAANSFPPAVITLAVAIGLMKLKE